MAGKPKATSVTTTAKIVKPTARSKTTVYTQKSLKQKQKSFKFTNSKRKTTTYGDI